MFPSIRTILLHSARQGRSIVVSSISHAKKKFNQKSAELTEIKKKPKARKRKSRLVIKRESDDIEAIWLENLTNENLKLFRKTSFGSFRKINLENLFKRLREIYPETFGSESLVKTTSPSSTTEAKKTHTTNEKAPPYLSEYIIKHIVSFPLLKTQTSTFSQLVQEEIEDYGFVDSQMFPSVSGILSETMSESARARLNQWKSRMTEGLGAEGFRKYQADLIADGAKLHSTLKTYLEVPDKRLVTVDPRIEGCWKSLQDLLPDISDVQFVEEFIYHPVLLYRGIVDCVASYRGTPCVIEWKKSERKKSGLSDTFDAPVQLCAYLGALPWHKKVTVKNGLVVVVYTDGTPASVFQMSLESCEVYWTEWLRRVQSYWMKKSPTYVENELRM